MFFISIVLIFFVYSHYFKLKMNKLTKISPIFQMVNKLDSSNVITKNNKIPNDLNKSSMDSVFRFVALPLDYKYGSNSIPLTVGIKLNPRLPF